MSSVLVGYATRYGSTQEVAQAVAATLRDAGHRADCRLLRDVNGLTEYEAVVLGAPLFMFRWHKDAHRFLERQRTVLGGLPVAVFALGPTHEPHDEQEWRDSWGQLEKELARHEWLTPIALEMFGGRYDPEKPNALIRWLAGKTPATDLRDWAAIRDWANGLGAMLGDRREGT